MRSNESLVRMRGRAPIFSPLFSSFLLDLATVNIFWRFRPAEKSIGVADFDLGKNERAARFHLVFDPPTIKPIASYCTPV
jgi:hypothetical protein